MAYLISYLSVWDENMFLYPFEAETRLNNI
jgi:hypothetical protein